MTVPQYISVRKSRLRALLLILLAAWLVAPGKVMCQVLDSFAEPIEHSELATSETGTVHDIRVKLGESVRQGQIIAALDIRSLEASLKIAQLRAASTAEVAAAQAKYQRAQQRLEKLKSVISQGHATQSELEQSEIELIVAQSELELAQEKSAEHRADVDRIQAQIEQRIIRSPFDGVVIQLHRKIGEFASNGNPNIATVVQLERLRVKFYVATSDAQALREGQAVPIELNGQIAQGQVEYISPVTDPKSGAVRVDVIIDNQKYSYRSGLRCRLAIDHPSAVSMRQPIK